MRWFNRSPKGTYTYTFNRDMTREEITEVTQHMDAAFAQLDEAFVELDKAFKSLRSR